MIGPGALRALFGRLLRALGGCTTQADVVQALFAELNPVFGYFTVNLQVLEQDGWYHSLAVARGVLQDERRRLLSDSFFADLYSSPTTRVIHPEASKPPSTVVLRGPGLNRPPGTVIWVPILHGGGPVGAVSYQLYSRREVPAAELALLERVHARLGVLVSSAYGNELTRNQAVSLGALNAIARALSAAQDERGVLTALMTTLSVLVPVDRLQLLIREEPAAPRVRVLGIGPDRKISRATAPAAPGRLGAAGQALATGRAHLETDAGVGAEHRSSASLPILEGGVVRGVLSTQCRQPDAYEQMTLGFLQQVADQTALALRNAWSYAAIDAQRRRLEVVNAVGSRLGSALDRESISQAVREELARFLDFDAFVLATVTETPDGPVAQGHGWDSGAVQSCPPVPLGAAGPSREAYESGRPVLIRRARWPRSLEARTHAVGERIVGDGVVIDVTRPGRRRRVAARSMVWVPVRDGEEVVALLSLQSYRTDRFDQWHVDVLQDVATHVGLALANSENFRVAQIERQRLEALHLLEVGVASATDEEQIGEAVGNALRSFVDAAFLIVGYLDPQGRVTGYLSQLGRPLRRLPPVPLESAPYLRRLLVERATIAEQVPASLRVARPARGWPTWGPDIPRQILSVPLFVDDRVIGALSAQRIEDVPFSPDEIRLLESAAPLVGIALRNVRLHRANELALASSARLQMVAGLAGHDLASVLGSVAEQVRTMLEAPGVACWAFDLEGRASTWAARGTQRPTRVLRWCGRTSARKWAEPPRVPVSGVDRDVAWTLVPLWYGEALVGAIGVVHGSAAVESHLVGIEEFAHHAAIAIENARLAAETRGRIRILQAVADFANLDITSPERARAEMCRLVERALAGSRGAMWLLEGSAMVRGTGGAATRIAAGQPDWWGPALRAHRAGPPGRRLRSLLRAGAAIAAPRTAEGGQAPGRGVLAHPVLVAGEVVGMLTADAAGSSPGETRQLMEVLALQASLVLERLQLVVALNRHTDMLTTVLAHTPVGVVLEDEAGRVLYANPEVERIYGVTARSLFGTPAWRLLERPDAVVVTDPEAEPGGPLELRLRDSETVVQVRQVPVPRSGDRPPRMLTLHEDVTQARAALEAKDLMLRAIGHEVRSPAAAMRSTIAGLLQWGTMLDAQQRGQLVLETYRQSERLLSLLDNQLLIARLETGRFEPNRSPVELSRCVDQVLTVLRHRYSARVRAVDVRLAGDLPDACCEPTHLDQVLTNLIGNALEYTQSRRVRVTARADGGWLEVTVADDGRGLPPDRQATVFAKTGPAGQGRSHGGLGLGLYLCRLVVERSFGGRIWLARTGPDGTVFKFTVPTLVPALQPAPAGG